MRSIRSRVAALAAFAALAGSVAPAAAQTPAPATNPVNRLLEAGEAVFGYFPRNPDPEQAASSAVLDASAAHDLIFWAFDDDRCYQRSCSGC